MSLMPLGLLSQGGGAGNGGNALTLISTQIISGSSTYSVTFSGINTTLYKHLQIRVVAKNGTNTSDRDGMVQFNGDTAANYSFHQLYGYGSGVASAGYGSQTYMTFGVVPGNTTTNAFGAAIIDILDAGNTSKFKTLRSLGGHSETAIRLCSGTWQSTSAITSITVAPNTGATYAYQAGSRISLYGVS